MGKEKAPVSAPYGAWRSPITAQMVAAGQIGVSEPHPEPGAVSWLELRPSEGGRYVLVRATDDGRNLDVTPPGTNVRTRVHEYGGGAFLVKGETVFFSNFEDQRLFRLDGDGQPRPITPEPPEPGAHRYADGRLTPDGRWFVCVRERHEGGEPVNELVAIPADGSEEPRIVASGHDFFSNPRPSPEGRRMAWLSWDHPRMPWDGSELWVAELSADGTLGEPRLVAGGPDESIFQPDWSPEGILHFVSDRTGWWNLYREVDGRVEALAPRDEEFGVPAWLFDMSTYAFLPGGRIACLHGFAHETRLGVLNPATGRIDDLDLPYTAYRSSLESDGTRLAFVGSSGTEPASVVVVDTMDGSRKFLRRVLDLDVDLGHVSQPRHVEFPTEGGLTGHALFYPPANRDVTGPRGERPPLIVLSHGGPTSHSTPEFVLSNLFWTSRGFAVVDVNYGGSTGYGRAYRQRLNQNWGVVDVADCVNAARWLADQGEVDGRRMAIRGGSAGGYCTLCALTFFPGVFGAGASYFGIGDLETFVKDTHKFESRYLDTLVGPYPEAKDVYRQRSPANYADRIACPVILFQGLEDLVVPPNQAEEMIRALEAKGLPYAYIPFEGEQHGFRKAKTIRRSLEAELSFYGRVFGFEPADRIDPVEVRNL